MKLGISLEQPSKRVSSTDYYLVPWTSIWSIVIDPTNSQIIYAGDHQSGVYMSTNGGSTWVPINEGLSTRAVTAMAISSDGKVLYAATEGEGVFRLGEVPEVIFVPTAPSGPTDGITGTTYTFSISGSISNIAHALEYQFDWKGDGSDLSPWGSATQSKTWIVPGIYNVKARARCTQDTSVVSDWSSGLSVTISAETVSMPNTPSGPTVGTTGKNYNYSAGGSSSNLIHPDLSTSLTGRGMVRIFPLGVLALNRRPGQCLESITSRSGLDVLRIPLLCPIGQILYPLLSAYLIFRSLQTLIILGVSK